MRRKSYISASVLLAMLLLLPVCKTEGQNIAVKSDLLTGMLSSPNLGVEVRLSERFTLETGFHYNPFPAGENKRWKHWFVQPELRYWMCQPLWRAFLRGEPDVRSVQCGKNETAFGALQGSALRQIRRKRHGCGLLRTATTLSSLRAGDWKQASA